MAFSGASPIINLRAAAAELDEYWSPQIIGQINDQYIKVAKVKGDFVWHKHDAEDEMFMILKGSLRMQYEDQTLELNEGDIHIVPRNTMHNPVAENECWVALIEPVATLHTGNIVTDKTKSIEEQM